MTIGNLANLHNSSIAILIIREIPISKTAQKV
jgi:hypothetical protein